MNRVNGIRFNGLHSYYDFGLWLSERPDWGSPEPKLNLVEIPGADGMLDLTEANAGEVKFANRTIELTFAAMVKVDEQERFKGRIMNALHGKVCTIIPDEDPDWYYHGRCSVAFTDLSSWKLRCVVTVDADPYAVKREDTVVNLHSVQPEYDTVNVHRSENINTGTPGATQSAFLFGTSQFPDGIEYVDDNNPGTSHCYDLVVSWGVGANVTSNPTIYVQDSAGHSYTENISASVVSSNGKTTQAGTATISISDIVTAGADPAKVWRIIVGVADCEIYTTKYVDVYRVWNERKSVIPVFALLDNPQIVTGITITVNGKDFFIEAGTHQYEDVVLAQGWNEILVTVLDDGQLWRTMTFSMTYREGRL